MNNIGRQLKRRLHLKFLLRSILVLVIGVVSFEIATIYQMSSLTHQLSMDQVSNSVENYASELDNKIKDIQSDNELFSNLPALQAYYLNREYGLEEEAQQALNSMRQFFVKQQQRESSYINLLICDASGEHINTIDSGAEHSRIDIVSTGKKLCSQDSSSTRKAIEKPYFLQQANHYYIAFSRKVKRDGELLGKIGIVFDMTDLFEKFSQARPAQSSGISVLEQKEAGGNGFAPIFTSGQISIPNSLPLADITDKSFIDADQIRNSNGQSFILQPVKGLPWLLAISVDKEKILEPVYRQIYLVSLLVLVLILVEIFFLNLFTKNIITQRIELLLKATREILSGNYDTRIPIKGNDEISELAISFNTMTASLQLEMAKLEDKQKKLIKSESRLQSILDNTSALIYIKDLNGRYLLVNKALEKVLANINKKIIDEVDEHIFSEEDTRQFRENDDAVINAGQPQSFEEHITMKDGTRLTYLVIKFPLFDDHQRIYATCGISTDITERKEFEQQLQNLNQRLKLNSAVIESSQEGILITDKNYRIIQVNPSLCRLFGYTREELIGQTPKLFRSGYHDQAFFDALYRTLETKGNWHGEIWEQTKTGEVIPQLLTITAVRDENGEITHFSGIYADISDLKQTEEKLHQLAHYDALTTLANRVLLEQRTEQAIKSAKKRQSVVALLFIDLDNFKYINDTLGHSIGDLLLKAIAERLIRIVRDSDTVARQGGDEFVILLTNLTDKNDALLIAEKARSVMNEPFSIKGQELFASSSIGVALYPDHADTAQGLLKCADIAMYSAKESGKNASRIFTPQMNHAALDRLSIEKSLRQAIDENEFEVFYQPILNTLDESVEKLEALIRWKRDSGFVSPDVFIPIAEESGLIIPIGEIVLAQACQALVEIRKQTRPDIHMSVNLSARQFRFPKLAEKLNYIVEENGLRADDIEFEITESLLVEDYKLAKRILLQLKHYGFSLALDDFGTGYSSLSYLNLFPLDTIKMDKTFVKEIGIDDRSEAILTASITMGQALGMKIVCEGIETLEQASFIKELGDIQLQGYFFAKPMPLREVKNYIHQHSEKLGLEYE